MPRVTWDNPGSRLYHVGVDRGMLYAKYFFAAWNGLVSVTENPTGGGSTPYYVDGQKVLNIAAGEDFNGTIQAFSAPLEFAPCVGRQQISPALYVAEQPKQVFGFSYRTLIGDDVSGSDFGYRVNLVYNAVAKSSDFIHETIVANVSAKTYSWDIVTSPIEVPGYRPTAHLVFDTRKNSTDVMSALETILYGDNTHDPRMPSVQEIITLLAS